MVCLRDVFIYCLQQRGDGYADSFWRLHGKFSETFWRNGSLTSGRFGLAENDLGARGSPVTEAGGANHGAFARNWRW